MRWRSGSSSRSSCRRRSSLARSLIVRSSYWLRAAPSAVSRSSLSDSASCRPACAAASDRRLKLGAGALVFVGQRHGLLRGGLDRAVEFAHGALRACAARRSLPAPGVPGCDAARGSRPARGRPRSRVRRAAAWRSWLSASCMSSSSKRPSAAMRCSCSSSSCASTSPRSAASCCAAGAGLLGQLRQAQRLDLQLVRARLRFGGFAPRRDQALRSIGVGRFGADQRGARFFADQRLGAQLALQVFHFLLAGQQAGLLGIRRVEADAVRGHGMAALHVDDLAGLQRVALGQRLFEARGGVAAVQPVGQQRLLARIVQAQQVGQARQRGRAFGVLRRPAGCRRPAWRAAHRCRRRGPCPGG